jgi:hypothetical protein
MKKLMFMFYLAVAVSVTSCDLSKSLVNRTKDESKKVEEVGVEKVEEVSKDDLEKPIFDDSTVVKSVSVQKCNYQENMAKWKKKLDKKRKKLAKEGVVTPEGAWEAMY